MTQQSPSKQQRMLVIKPRPVDRAHTSPSDSKAYETFPAKTSSDFLSPGPAYGYLTGDGNSPGRLTSFMLNNESKVSINDTLHEQYARMSNFGVTLKTREREVTTPHYQTMFRKSSKAELLL